MENKNKNMDIAQNAESQSANTCSEQASTHDHYFELSEDAKFGTLLMLLPALTLSFFNVAGLI